MAINTTANVLFLGTMKRDYNLAIEHPRLKLV